MSYDRGAVVVATDPFKDDSNGRPFLVINNAETPFHGEQYIALSLTTRTWHDARIPLEENDWIEGEAPDSSSILPSSANSLKSEWIDYYQGALHRNVVNRAVSQLTEYIRE